VTRRSLAPLCAFSLALALSGCGKEVPHGGARAPIGPRVVRDVSATDLIPDDLDVVVRVDVARLRAGLGPAAYDDLKRAALEKSEDRVLEASLACAQIVWIGLRVADLEAGDRVIVVEGKDCAPKLEDTAWDTAKIGTATVRDRLNDPPRAATSRIAIQGSRFVAFASSVERDSLGRVLAKGPDQQRGDPSSEGVVSFDARSRPLAPDQTKRFPSIARVLRGVSRVRGSAVVLDEGLRLDGEIACTDTTSAKRAAGFVLALRENAESDRARELLKRLTIETIDKTVRYRWLVPADAIRPQK
jgi:hypothetical protein